MSPPDLSTGPGVPGVSVVVATRNRRHMLEPFVEALGGDPVIREIVVVVDGDVDGSSEVLEELRLRNPLLRGVVVDSQGQLGALELGVSQCRSEVVLLMDDDVVAGPGLASGHARHHAGAPGQVVTGYMPVALRPGVTAATRLYAAEYEEHCRQLESGQRAVLRALWLGNVSARRDDLMRVGMASPEFSGTRHSDLDFGLRLEADGLRGVFDRRLVASHLHSRTAEAFLGEAEARGRSTWMLEQAHPDRFDSAHTTPMLDDLSPPVRHMVSFLGSGERAVWSSRTMMQLGAGVERLGLVSASTTMAKVARRVRLVGSYRRAESDAATPR